MRLFVYIEQIFGVHMRVPLCCRQTGVTQQLLNRSQVSAALKEVGGKRVPQRVGARFRANVRSAQAASDDPTHRSVRQCLAVRAWEQRTIRLNFSSCRQIGIKRLARGLPEWNPPLFSSFTKNTNRPVAGIDVSNGKPYDFGATHSR